MQGYFVSLPIKSFYTCIKREQDDRIIDKIIDKILLINFLLNRILDARKEYRFLSFVIEEKKN